MVKQSGVSFISGSLCCVGVSSMSFISFFSSLLSLSLSPSKSFFFSDRGGCSVLALLHLPPPPPPPLFTSVLHLSVTTPVISIFITDTDIFTLSFNIKGPAGVLVSEFSLHYLQFEMFRMKGQAWEWYGAAPLSTAKLIPSEQRR